jgi:hypothetical protein
MKAVWFRTRAEARSTWRAWMALALLLGLAGGVAIGAVAGARRTQSAYPRLVAWSRTADVETGEFPEGVDPAAGIRRIVRLPSVSDWARLDVVAGAFILPGGKFVTQPQLFGISDLSGHFFTSFGRAKVLTGRLYDPRSPHEAVIDFAAAERVGLHAGDTVLAVLGDPFAKPRRTVPVRIVGVVAHPRVFPAFGANSVVATVELSPAFAPAFHVRPDLALSSLELRLRGGAAAVPAFLRQARQVGVQGSDVPYVQTERTAGVQRSTRIESDALWLLAAVMVLAAGAVLGQAMSRQTWMASSELGTLRAVGMSRRELFTLGLARGALTGAVAALAAVIVAMGLSSLTPIGLARLAEPSPGLAVDLPALLVGAFAVVVGAIALVAVPAWRAASHAGAAQDAESNPSVLASLATRRVPSPVVGVGVRMALEPGRGRAAVPVRSAILGTTLAIAALVAAMTFWSSLQHLVGTPGLSGFTWDLFVNPPTDPQGNALADGTARIQRILQSDENVDAFERGTVISVRVDGRLVGTVVTSGTGRIGPAIVAGRAPLAPDEIALGAGVMGAGGAGIGQTVEVEPPAGSGSRPPTSMRVVGQVIAPTSLNADSDPGQGAAITFGGIARIQGEPLSPSIRASLPFFVRFREGIDGQAETDRLLGALPAGAYNIPSEHRADIVTLGRITRVPLALAVLLGLIALATLAQTLVTSVRARRTDLAVLKTLGFSRRQVRATVAWQASALVSVALLIGIPAGLAAGRWIWRAFGDGIAVVPVPVFRPWWIVATAALTVVVANVIAAIPGRTAARTHPAVVLRSE